MWFYVARCDKEADKIWCGRICLEAQHGYCCDQQTGVYDAHICADCTDTRILCNDRCYLKQYEYCCLGSQYIPCVHDYTYIDIHGTDIDDIDLEVTF